MKRIATAGTRNGGFTLLETIVTLVVVSLIVVVLMQALQQALGLRTRLLRHERQTRTEVLQEQWFRDSVAAAIADLPDGLGAMEGSPQAFAMVSAGPLSGPGLSRIGWTLRAVDGGFALDYTEGTAPPLNILPGPLADASFGYMDADGSWLQAWKVDAAAELPEPGNDLARPRQPEVLPRMVRLQAMTEGGPLSWLVPIMAEPHPPALLRPEEYGLDR